MMLRFYKRCQADSGPQRALAIAVPFTQFPPPPGLFPVILKAMSLLSPRLQLKLAQKQILTPSLLQMVTVLQLNRLELKEMINQEIVENPVLEESTEDSGEEITPEELMPLLEGERVQDPQDHILEAAMVDSSRTDGAPGDISDLYAEPAAPEVAAELAV